MDGNNKNNLFDMYNAGESEENETEDLEKVNSISEKEEKKDLVNDTDNKFINKIDEDKKEKDTKAVPDFVMNEASKGTDDIKYLSDEELLRIYVGKNYEKISRGSFSLPTFIFGINYLFYRKMYVIAIPLLIITIVSLFSFTLEGFSIPGVIILLIDMFGVVFSFFFKKIYMNKARRFVSEIQATNLSNNDKKRRALNNGGVDNRIFLIVILISVAILVYNFFNVIVNFEKILGKSLTPEIVYTVPDWAKKNVKEFSDDGSVKKTNAYVYHDRLFDYKDSNSSCNFRVSSTNEYTTSNNNLNQVVHNYMFNRYNIDGVLVDKKYNGLDYKYYYDSTNNIHYYVHVSDNMLTLLKIDIHNDTDKSCEKLTNDLLEGAKLEKDGE